MNIPANLKTEYEHMWFTSNAGGGFAAWLTNYPSSVGLVYAPIRPADYIFFPSTMILFNAPILREIADFLDALNAPEVDTGTG